jgi:hypothetical protein
MNFEPSGATESTAEIFVTERLRRRLPEATSNTNTWRVVLVGLLRPMMNLPSAEVTR